LLLLVCLLLLPPQPREYKSKEAAGQMRRSPHQFTGIGSLSPTLWLARGYAVLDGPGFPIVAEGDEEPNDTYVEQLTASAEAAVKVRAWAWEEFLWVWEGQFGCAGPWSKLCNKPVLVSTMCHWR
jgi:hypothetical protein